MAIEGYKLGLDEQSADHLHLCASESNIGYIYNTADNHIEAKRYLEKARDRWEKWLRAENEDPIPWRTVQKPNLERCLVYIDQYDEAAKLLCQCNTEFKSTGLVNWSMLA